MSTAAAQMFERLAFDSDLFGVGVWRTSHVGNWSPAGCTFLLLDSSETAQIHKAEQQGYRLMDIRVTLEAETCPHGERYAHLASTADAEALCALAAVSYRGGTRFYNDPRLPDALCDELYETWLRESLDDLDVTVLVVHRRDQPVGYITMHGGERARIGLIAVDDRARGQGIGSELVLAALDLAYQRGQSRMEVVTQGQNAGALRLYERCGFHVANVSVWLHRWSDDG